MERWVKIEGYENYEVSNCGRVKRVAHSTKTRNRNGECWRHYKEKLIDKYGLSGGNKKGSKGKYRYVCLTDRDGNQKAFAIHRLVATYFCENPNGYVEVDHIDRNTLNNNSENLRWVSHCENCRNRGK